MENVCYLGGAAPDQFREKRIGGVTGGISTNSGLMELDEADSQVVKLLLDDGCKEQTCMHGRVMEKSWMNSLGFMDLMVHGKTIQVVVDWGATHNFMMTRLAKEVGLMIFPLDVEVKVVNFRAKVVGLVHEVPVKIR